MSIQRFPFVFASLSEQQKRSDQRAAQGIRRKRIGQGFGEFKRKTKMLVVRVRREEKHGWYERNDCTEKWPLKRDALSNGIVLITPVL